MQSKASTVAEYLASLPADRREIVNAVRAVILKNLDGDLREGMQYGMIGYFVPHDVFPAGYHCDPRQPLPYAGLASQKQGISLYLMGVYGDEGQRSWFVDAWKKTGIKLDMGKACIRFRSLEGVPLQVVGEAIRRLPARAYINRYLELLNTQRSATKTTAKPASKKASPKKAPPKKPVAKSPAKKKAKASPKKPARRASRTR